MQGGIARRGSTFASLELNFNIWIIVIGVKEVAGFLKNTLKLLCVNGGKILQTWALRICGSHLGGIIVGRVHGIGVPGDW